MYEYGRFACGIDIGKLRKAVEGRKKIERSTFVANENKQSFLQGALVLIIANILIVKSRQVTLKYPLTTLSALDGMGLFLVAYYLYNMMFVLSTA